MNRSREEQINSLCLTILGGLNFVEDALPIARQHIEEAEQRARAEQAEDAARLDWLEGKFRTSTVYMSGEFLFSPNHAVRNMKGQSFRAAIDAARGVAGRGEVG